MQDADNLNSTCNRSVEGKIFTDHDTSDICSNILPRNTYARLGRDEFPSFFYSIKQPVRRWWIFHRDTEPDFDKAFFGLRAL